MWGLLNSIVMADFRALNGIPTPTTDPAIEPELKIDFNHYLDKKAHTNRAQTLAAAAANLLSVEVGLALKDNYREQLAHIESAQRVMRSFRDGLRGADEN